MRNVLVSKAFKNVPLHFTEGSMRGYGFSPLYRSVPKAVAHDNALYELLALVDAIRDGRAREREMAVKELTARLNVHE